MPFAQQQPRAFTRQNIEVLKPDQGGVYGLFKEGTCVYVGKGDIRQRLLDHLSGDNSCISNAQPIQWVAEIISGDPSEREKQLILELNPTCNERIG